MKKFIAAAMTAAIALQGAPVFAQETPVTIADEAKKEDKFVVVLADKKGKEKVNVEFPESNGAIDMRNYAMMIPSGYHFVKKPVDLKDDMFKEEKNEDGTVSHVIEIEIEKNADEPAFDDNAEVLVTYTSNAFVKLGLFKEVAKEKEISVETINKALESVGYETDQNLKDSDLEAVYCGDKDNKTVIFYRHKKNMHAINVKDPVIMQRLYNPNSGEHFYTADMNEKETLVTLGWVFEGDAWKAPAKSDVEVLRLYNPNAGDHHYTTDKHEYTELEGKGWQGEGRGWYSADKENGVAIYRLYNPNAKAAGAHHYTTDKNEKDTLVGYGWVYEGEGFYGLK